MARFPGAARLAVEHGWTAYDRRDWTEMARRFEHVRDRFPDDPSGYVGLGAALREQGRPADADTVFAAGIARFPDRLDLLINHAWSGHRAGDWPEALRRWAVVTTSHPDDPSGYGGTAVTARQAGRPDLEDAVLLVACERFPTIVQFAERHAEAAAARADWPEAVRRWQTARERFPAHESCHVGLAHALLAATRADEAETVFSQAVERFPRNLEIATEYARIRNTPGWPATAMTGRGLCRVGRRCASGFPTPPPATSVSA
jgi:predicted Zn-dependent protease